MTQPRPTADELLEAVRTFLEDELLPGLEGRLRFHTRVAVNVLDTVGRELRDGPAADAAERSRLVALLAAAGAGSGTEPGEGEPGEGEPAAGPAGEADADADALSRALAERIRRGDLALDDPALLAHLVETARADVAIANPRHLGDPASPSGGQ